MKKYKLEAPTEYEKKMCMLFAKNCVGTNIDEYSRRNQSNSQKIINDIYNGKLAECMVHKLLLKNGKRPQPIDFHIYPKEWKSFDADIHLSKSRFHVKSTLADSPFPNSWLFQPWDSVVKSPEDDEFLALVVVGDNSYCYLMPAKGVQYGSPVKKSLNKKVIYEDALIKDGDK